MLTTILRRAVKANPARAAIVQGGRRIRYDELDALVGRCAAGLRQLGVRSDTAVAVVLPNCPEFVAALFACVRLRALMAPLNPQCGPEELRRFLADAQPKVIVTDRERAGLLVGSSARVVEFDALLGHLADPAPAGEFRGPALYLYTSGSTDSWKRLCCTQENLYYEAHDFVETVGLKAVDNILCTIPLHHSYGLGNCLLDAVYAGSTLVLLEPDEAPFAAKCQRVLELIRAEDVRFYPGVPFQFHILAGLADGDAEALKGLKLCVSSGDVLPRCTYERFLTRFGCPIRSLYGSTEAGSISIDLDPAETMPFGSLGLPLRNVDIRIRDAAGRELHPDESGAIWVKSPVLPPTGYDNRHELTASVFRDGYYNTGDIGMRDARGRLFMTGRKQTFIEVGGHKVDLGEVEEVLHGHPQVREAAAVGVEVPGLDTVVKAVVVRQGACDRADILAHCRARLASYKVPRLVEFRAALPRSPVGKVLKSELGGIGSYLNTAKRAEFEAALQNAVHAGAAGQREVLAAHIREQAALTLQCEPASLGRLAEFRSLGLDSLLTAELHLRLVRLTGLELSITMLWNYPTIDELAAALLVVMQAKKEVRTTRTEAAHVPQVASRLDDVTSEVDGLSEAEVAASLRAR
jgi:long-chain acyl-CoA synthetase